MNKDTQSWSNSNLTEMEELLQKVQQLETENAALRRDVYQCPPTSENEYEGLKWADAFEVIERDNAELHNKLVALQHQSQWQCSCGGTDCEGQKENAELRELINEPYQFFRFGHKALFPWGKFLDRWCKRAEKLGFKKEAKP